MKIAIGSDHRGMSLKEKLIQFLRARGCEVADLGTHSKTKATDYPDIAAKLGRSVARGTFDRGLLICGTGIGMSISANKIRGIRAARCVTKRDAVLSREHNDANVLALGSSSTNVKLAKEIVRVWLNTPAEGGRHRRRVNKILKLEKGSS